jgi:polar amino acid transport system substrate-binding protein
LRPVPVLLALLLGLIPSALLAQEPLRWGGDAEGGAPFVEADPRNPSQVAGFDVEIAELIAAGLGRRAEFVQSSFTELDQSVRRGDFEIALSGIEDTSGRRRAVAVSIPYYEFEEVLTVREGDRDQFRALSDLAGHPVGTLAGTIAYEALLEAERAHGVRPVVYEDDIHPYSDLLIGRVDAVLLDHVLAERAQRRMTGLVTQPGSVRTGHYVVIAAPESMALRDRVNEILIAAMGDGRLEAILRRWNVWNDAQPTLHARVLASPEQFTGAAASASSPPPSRWATVRAYLPLLIRAAALTLALSCASMALAVLAGILIAVGRVYGARPVQWLFTGFVEVIRGTPLLLQLFVLYYGLAAVIRLPAWLAAIAGLGLNYAAYESEIYRAALLAIPRGQIEAAQVLGFSPLQTLRLVRGPQAFRLALAPMTNDFVAMLKDSSLVSVLTVAELTKQTQMFATNIGSWVVPGALCAALYLAMSLPLARAARALERRWQTPTSA